jgi:hypothetical protein
MYKNCTRCKKRKQIENFPVRKNAKVGYYSMCRDCKREYDKEYYVAHPQRKNYIKKNRYAARKEAIEFIRNYLKMHPCVDCGEKDPIVLEFDHVRGEKRSTVSKLKQSSKTAVEEEIKKCAVRCANCHRRKTAKQFKWKK